MIIDHQYTLDHHARSLKVRNFENFETGSSEPLLNVKDHSPSNIYDIFESGIECQVNAQTVSRQKKLESRRGGSLVTIWGTLEIS